MTYQDGLLRTIEGGEDVVRRGADGSDGPGYAFLEHGNSGSRSQADRTVR